MKKILFEAITARGEKITSFIDEESNANALLRLKDRGYREIKFYNDANLSSGREYLEGKSEQQIQQIAKREIAVHKEGLKQSSFMLAVLKNNLMVCSVCVLLFLVGLFTGHYAICLLPALILGSLFVIAKRKYTVPEANNDAEKAYALGDYGLFRQKKAWLEKHIDKPFILFYLDAREAFILAGEGRVTDALALIEKWRELGEASHPGLCESRIATIYQKSGDYQQALTFRTLGYEKSGYSQINAIDLAMMEVRHGDLNRAAALLSGIRLAELTPSALFYVDWVNGLIAAKQGGESAESTFNTVVAAVLERADKPLMWISTALCVGDYAEIVQSYAGKKHAEQLLQRFWTIYVAHGEKEQVASLRLKYPALKG
jgi:tetratricopeptide (TPR) repeat protein